MYRLFVCVRAYTTTVRYRSWINGTRNDITVPVLLRPSILITLSVGSAATKKYKLTDMSRHFRRFERPAVTSGA